MSCRAELRLARGILGLPGILALACPSVLAQGNCGTDGQILTRTDLNARLGASAVVEDFESYQVGTGTASVLTLACVDDLTVDQGQGPGLVQAGATYCAPAGTTLQWNGDQYYQLTTRTLLSNGGGSMQINYTPAVGAMGVDLLAYIGYPDSGTATFYDSGSNVLGTVNYVLTTGGSERFFVGWAHAAGIARVELLCTAYPWSALLDDHAYGSCSGGIGAPSCFGDNLDPLVTTDCPCQNFGAPGHGCANATNSFGAQLSGTGSTSPDTVHLTSTGELASSLSIFLQGTASINAGITFGDGVRCVGGLLRRLYSHNASGGNVSAPIGGDLSISARSAQLGDPLASGTLRYYQVYYRDSHLSFCSGAGFNASNALPIHW